MADASYGKRGENPIYERFGGFDRVNNLWFEPRPDDRTPVWGPTGVSADRPGRVPGNSWLFHGEARHALVEYSKGGAFDYWVMAMLTSKPSLELPTSS